MKFTSLLKSVILEQSKFEVLFDALTKPSVDKEGKKMKPKLSKEEFYELMQADPTTMLNNVDLMSASPEELKKVKAGKFTAWIIKNYLTPKTERQPGDRGYEEEVKQAKATYIEDLSKITNDLMKFVRFKDRIEGERDLNKMTPSDLYNKVKDFSLEKTKASAQEKKEASKTFEHPGGQVIFRGNDWTVVKISDKAQLGKDAACFYGGYYLEPSKGETRWCTSGPGLSYFERYIKDGPLYVIIKNTDSKVGEKSQLPATRYQFHFPSNQFMDAADHSIDLVKYLNGPMAELKDIFKPEFAKGLTVGGEKLVIDSFSHGAIGKFIALYGLDDLIGNLPVTLREFQIQNRDSKNNEVLINIPDEIGRFKDLEMILLDNCIESIPESICTLPKLRFLALINNPKLTSIPDCIADLPNLYFLNLKGSPNVKVPQTIMDKASDLGNGMLDLQGS
jgi:hypothetical protein